MPEQYKTFVAYFFFVGWDCLSLGVHVCLGMPNIEVHLPFGFIRLGWIVRIRGYEHINKANIYGRG